MANIELAKAYVTIVPSMEGAKKSIEDGLNDASSSAGNSAGEKSGKSFGSAFGNGIKTATKVTAAAIGVATGATIEFSRESIKAGLTFDSSMSQVAATMGLTVDEIGDLRDYALEMGSSTAFSASQAADALNYMALAGYDAETSMTMLPNVLNLAAAGGIDLAYASDMVTDASSALGLSLDDTTLLVDQMAKTASSSNTSVSQLGEALLTIGATGANVAGGTTELATVLGVLADNGIKGSEAGTHLRNMILSLTNPTDSAAKMLTELGISVYDSEGNLRNMVDIIGDLQTALNGMTQEESDSVVSTIFNKTDLASVNALLNTSAERFDELGLAIENADGAASAMADTQLDNLAGDITLFKSALEGAQIAVSDMLTPSLREFVQMGSEGISRLTTAFQEGGLENAMGELGTWLSDVLSTILKNAPMIVSAGINLIKTLGKGIVDNAPMLADAALEVLQLLVDELTSAVDSGGIGDLVNTALEIVMKLGEFLIQNAPALINATAELINQLVTMIAEPDNLTKLIEMALQLCLVIADGLVKAFPTVVEVIPALVSGITIALINTFPEILSTVGTLIGDLGMLVFELVGGLMGLSYDEIVDNLIAVSDFISGSFDDIGSAVTDFCSDVGGFFSDLWSDITGFFTDGITSVGGVLDDWWDTLTGWFTDLISDALSWGKDLVDNFVDGMLGGLDKVGSGAKKIAGEVKSFLGFSEPEKGPLSNFHTYAPDMIDLFTEGLYEGAGELESTFNSVLSLPDPESGEYISEDSYYEGASTDEDSNITIPVYIGQDRLDTIILKSLKTSTYLRGG